MATVTTTGDIGYRTAGVAVARLLKRGQAVMVFERFGQIDPQGQNKSRTRRWRRPMALALATAPMAEGVSPPGQKLNFEDIEVSLEQYGDNVTITDVIQDTHEDPVLQAAEDEIAIQSAETIEVLRFHALRAGSSVHYANNVVSRATVASAPLRGDFRKIKRALKVARAREITQIIKASAKIATQPVQAGYFAIAHTDLEADLTEMPGWKPVVNYANSDEGLDGEIGAVDSMRFICTQFAEPWLAAGASTTTLLTSGAAGTGAADVYPVLVFAKDGYGMVPLSGKNAIDLMVKNPGKPDSGDKNGQLGWVSWKSWQATVILNQQWVRRYECGATANPA